MAMIKLALVQNITDEYTFVANVDVPLIALCDEVQPLEVERQRHGQLLRLPTRFPGETSSLLTSIITALVCQAMRSESERLCEVPKQCGWIVYGLEEHAE